jgi:hypothetical protein
MQMTGVLEFADGRYFLTDTTSKTRVEIRGADLVKFRGKSVQIVGSVILGATAAGGASQVVQVTKIELSSQAGKAAALAGAGSGAAAAAGGVNGWLIAGIGAVVVGGTLGGLAAAGAGPFSSSSTP